ncbi:MAG: N-acetylglucosaminyltransferase [Deltaproteobacteria bacterium]|nr:MAG: N-acetylglucosaminyltransferase [Deltaproteobacteria bacterium]
MIDDLLNILAASCQLFIQLITSPLYNGLEEFIYKFVPFVLFFELPLYIMIWLGIIRYYLRSHNLVPVKSHFNPMVSCIVLCYSEGDEVKNTIISLTEQLYPGQIEILAMIDGAGKNIDTYNAAMSMQSLVSRRANRRLRVIPKWQRGGRVSSLNAGLSLSEGVIVMALDGDTSFDNTMVQKAVPHFADPNVVGVAGNLRVRNFRKSIITRLQALEYMLSIHAAKIGLSEFNVVNNISGAFGIFRKSMLETIGGWDSGTAEDLDMTLKLKGYFGRNPQMRIVFEPGAMGHTDVPETFFGLLDQRLRWDGDLYYLYVRKRRQSFNHRIIGVRNLLMTMWAGLFFQLVMPMMIIVYTCYSFFLYPPAFVIGLSMVIYLLYFIIVIIFFTIYIIMVSERKEQDLSLAFLLPLLPVFFFVLRLWSGIATLKELTLKTHLDSSMAPWWVLKRTKF